jgi:hypothetical protein
MSQRSFCVEAVGAACATPIGRGSTADREAPWLLCMIADLPEHGSPIAASDCSVERNGSFVAKDETVREIAVRRAAGGALRVFASQKR